MLAIFSRDPACEDLTTPFLFYKGFHALQAHRIANWLWQNGRRTLAQFFQSQISVTLGVDFHPAARVGSGIMLDHATGIVVGETAVIEDDVSILHSVTLGGTGKTGGDRHPEDPPRGAARRRLQGHRQHRSRRRRQGRCRQRGAR